MNLWSKAILIFSVPTLCAANDYALLIGVQNYGKRSGLNPLRYSENDVEALSEVLTENGHPAANVTVMTQTRSVREPSLSPTRDNILRELNLLLDGLEETDSVLVAFAGHGVKFRDDDVSYFCPVDAEVPDRKRLLSFQEIYSQLQKCKAGRKLLISDACRNDPIASGTRAASSVTRPEPPPPTGTTVAFFSCQAGQEAREDDALKQGVFFHFLLKGLRGEADAAGAISNSNGTIELSELVAFTQRSVRDHVRSQFRAKQEPILQSHANDIEQFVRFPVLRVNGLPMKRLLKFVPRSATGIVYVDTGRLSRLSPKTMAAILDHRRDGQYGLPFDRLQYLVFGFTTGFTIFGRSDFGDIIILDGQLSDRKIASWKRKSIEGLRVYESDIGWLLQLDATLFVLLNRHGGSESDLPEFARELTAVRGQRKSDLLGPTKELRSRCELSVSSQTLFLLTGMDAASASWTSVLPFLVVDLTLRDFPGAKGNSIEAFVKNDEGLKALESSIGGLIDLDEQESGSDSGTLILDQLADGSIEIVARTTLKETVSSEVRGKLVKYQELQSGVLRVLFKQLEIEGQARTSAVGDVIRSETQVSPRSVRTFFTIFNMATAFSSE